jgi:hypothetical protein
MFLQHFLHDTAHKTTAYIHTAVKISNPAYIQGGTKVTTLGVKNEIILHYYFILLLFMFTCQLIPF